MSEMQRKGDIGVTQAIATFTKHGFNVAVPISESTKYDLVVECNGKLYRVQTKYNSSRSVDLRSVHANTKRTIMVKYASGDFDWLYVLQGGKEYLVTKDLGGRTGITMNDEYLLDTVLAAWSSG